MLIKFGTPSFPKRNYSFFFYIFYKFNEIKEKNKWWAVKFAMLQILLTVNEKKVENFIRVFFFWY